MPDFDPLITRFLSLVAEQEGTATGWLEDNFHHFGVRITHQNGVVNGVDVLAVRYPWTTCPGAAQPLRALIGTPLEPRAERLSCRFPMAVHCTHMFELAALTMAQAVRGPGERRYVVRVSGGGGGNWLVRLERDGLPHGHLEVAVQRVVAPPEHVGRHMYDGFRSWIGAMSADEAEAMWIMRRGQWLSEGLSSFEARAVASETGLGPVCHTYQPEQRDQAFHMQDSQRDPSTLGLAKPPGEGARFLPVIQPRD